MTFAELQMYQRRSEHGVVAFAIVLLMATGALSFSMPSSVVSRSKALPAAQSLHLRSRARPRLVACQGDLGKEFEQERKTREEMDRIFKKASDDLKTAAEAELNTMAEEAEQLLQQREEEWEKMKNKAAESLTSKVDALAEDFLKSTGRVSDEDDEDEEFGMQKFLGPQVVALAGPEGALRNALEERLKAQAGISIISCDKLLNTRGMTIESADTLIFLGNEDPLDRSTVERLILRAADEKSPTSLRFVLLVSSLGSRRSDEFPWSMKNAFSGVLDKKRSVELGVEQLSKEEGFAYSVLHIGGISSDTNAQDVSIVAGDEQEGDVCAPSAAEAVVQALMLQPAALNASMSVVGTAGPAPSQMQWDDQFLRLDGPELWREGLGAGSVKAAKDFIQNTFGPRFLKPGSGLTTPVDVVEVANGVQLVFKPSSSTFVSFKEEKAAEKARERGEDIKDDQPRREKDKEGGVEVVIEESPYPRVRALRCNMGEGTVVKEQSEQIIMSSLKKDMAEFSKGK